MNSPNGKQCPGCNCMVKGGNKSMLIHMQKNKKCSSFLLQCIGCKKPFVDIAHLNNHQKQQSTGSSCLHGHDKMNYVQSLNMIHFVMSM